MLLYVHKNRRLIRDGSPGRPHRLLLRLLSSEMNRMTFRSFICRTSCHFGKEAERVLCRWLNNKLHSYLLLQPCAVFEKPPSYRGTKKTNSGPSGETSRIRADPWETGIKTEWYFACFVSDVVFQVSEA